MKKISKNILWFSIIELLVGIFIFSMWLVSIYAIIVSTLKLNDYNRDYIIATNLAREQLELIRNYRDTNYEKYQKYNQINTNTMDYNNVFGVWVWYTIENNFDLSAPFPISLLEISDINDRDNYKLCLDSENRYTYDCSWADKETNFYKYIYIDDVKYDSGAGTNIINKALKITSKVKWYNRWEHEFEIKMILTDWQRL